MKKFLIIFLLISTPAWGADSVYYVAQTAAGAEDCSTESDPCTLTTLDTNWATIRTQLDSNDVRIKLNRGDTFSLSANWTLGDTITNKTYRTYIEDYGTGDKPKLRRSSGAIIIRPYEYANLTLKNLDIAYTGTPDNGSTCVRFKNSDANGADGFHSISCDYSNADYAGIALDGDSEYPIIQGNTFTNLGNGFYTVTAGGATPQYGYAADNTCTNMDVDNVFGQDGHCIAIYSASNWVVEDNIVYDFDTAGFINFIGSGFSGNNNVFRRNKALTAGGIHGIVVAYEDNTGTANASRNLIYLNEVENVSDDASYGTGITFINLEPASIGNRAFNNTIYATDDYGIGTRDDNNNAYFYNNIVWTDGYTAGDRLAYLYDRGLGDGMGSDNYFSKNLYWTDSGDPSAQSVWVDETDTARTWAAWKATSGYDTDSPAPANPLFVDAASDDFSLQSGSPAIDAGTWLATITQATGSGTQFTVDDGGWFHGRFGTMVDEDGNAVNGTPIALSNGQTGTITVVSGNTITVSSTISWVQNTTKIALSPVYGSAPDIGANEWQDTASARGIKLY